MIPSYDDTYADRDSNGIPDQFDLLINEAKKTSKISAQFPADFDNRFQEEPPEEVIHSQSYTQNQSPNPIIISDTINRKALIFIILLVAGIFLFFFSKK